MAKTFLLLAFPRYLYNNTAASSSLGPVPVCQICHLSSFFSSLPSHTGADLYRNGWCFSRESGSRRPERDGWSHQTKMLEKTTSGKINSKKTTTCRKRKQKIDVQEGFWRNAVIIVKEKRSKKKCRRITDRLTAGWIGRLRRWFRSGKVIG